MVLVSPSYITYELPMTCIITPWWYDDNLVFAFRMSCACFVVVDLHWRRIDRGGSHGDQTQQP